MKPVKLLLLGSFLLFGKVNAQTYTSSGYELCVSQNNAVECSTHQVSSTITENGEFLVINNEQEEKFLILSSTMVIGIKQLETAEAS